MLLPRITRQQLESLCFSSFLLHRHSRKVPLHCLIQEKEMASTIVTFLSYLFALVLLMHCTHAAPPPPSFHHRQSRKTWCVAKPSADETALRANLEFACSESDCRAIQGTGGCSEADGLLLRASLAMNDYYQARGRNSWNCFFNGTGLITITDPSLGSCKYACED